MKEHHLFKINWMGFPKTHRKISGCYMIGNVYIGASTSIRSRIIQHCAELYSIIYNNYTILGNNPKNIKEKYLVDCIRNNKIINVTYINEDVNEELNMHIKYNIKPNDNAVMYHQLNKKNECKR